VSEKLTYTAGGMSHFSNYRGLGCDHVESFEIVLPSGKIVEASATENSDLHWALKGGGSNFGIVTRLNIKTNPDNTLWYSIKMYKALDAKAVIKAAVEVSNAMMEDDRLGIICVLTAQVLTIIGLYRNGTETPAAFNVFDDIEPMMVAVPGIVATQAACAEALGVPGELR
jgi:FAD/FMN-containing dehydrogenase